MATSSEREQAAGRPTRVEDDPGFESLFLEHWGRVYRVLFRLTGNHAEAEDLAVETFWRLWRRPPKDARSLSGWLYRVATNLGYNALRAARRRRDYEIESGRDALEQPVRSNPSDAVETADERRRVRQVLGRMNPRQAKLLILRHSGLSYKEIAGALNLKPSSIGTLLGRAEKDFIRLYESGEDHAPD